jgi:nucleotide-binding universal stress UspA family protein
MYEIRTILHPTDFSASADLALQLAGSLARDHRARLIVLHIGRPPVSHLGGGPALVPPLPGEWGREQLELQLRQRTVPALEQPLDHRLVFAEDAGAAILRTAEEVQCDLIVLGTHGRTGLGRLLMGSTAEQVARRANCPVLTVRHLPTEEPATRP